MTGKLRNPIIDGIQFIGPNIKPFEEERVNEISSVPGLPKPYRRDNLIATHLTQASFLDALYLSDRNHINLASGEGFKCISFYSEDQRGIALSSKEAFGYLATMDAAFVRQLIKISSQIGKALDRRRDRSTTQPKLEQDPQLNALLEGNSQVPESEALEIISNWPSSSKGKQIDLGSYTLFYDMIRLIWLHEWAHALCGHLTVVKMELGLGRLYEFSTERAGTDSDKKLPFPQNEVIQALEIHADEFATRYCVGEILWGYDPMAEIAGRTIDLVDRLLMFNVACCVFTVVWALAEKKYAPEDTFYPPHLPLELDVDEPWSQMTKSTHPPAALRYDRFRNFQRELALKYGLQQGGQASTLSTYIDAASFRFLDTLGEISRYFPSLLMAITPMVARTPTMYRLEDYEKHLLEIGNTYLHPKLEKFCYQPTSST